MKAKVPVQILTNEGESAGEDHLDGLMVVLREGRGGHGVPQLGVLVAHWVVPHSQLGPFHGSHIVAKAHVLPNSGEKKFQCYFS